MTVQCKHCGEEFASLRALDRHWEEGCEEVPDRQRRRKELVDLYELMEDLSDEHDADEAWVQKQGQGRAAIILEYDIPEADE